ncbi:MAG: type II secretion system protein [Candidatus Paceibacterota bacterium]
MKGYFSKTGGFSLIELLVVITIISLLTGIAIKSISGSKVKARDAQRVSDLGHLQLALALYLDRCGSYPSSLSVGTANGCPSGTTLGSYISQIPVPPSGASQASYDYAILNNGSSVYVSYVLHADLEANNPAVLRGLNAASIPQPGGSYSWSPSTTAAPYTTCSNATNSVDYCVIPN